MRCRPESAPLLRRGRMGWLPGALLLLTGLLGGPAVVLAQQQGSPAQEVLPGTDQVFGNRIAEIRVEGNRRTEKEQVLLVISSRVGEPIDRETIAGDVRRLYDLGVYDDVVVEAERTAQGWALIFRVKERPSIASISVEGVEQIEDDEVQQIIGIDVNSIYSEQKIQDAKKRLLDRYAQDGYYLARVDVLTERDSEKNQIRVTFRVDEGDEVYIRRIEFVGNTAFSDEELKSIENLPIQERAVFPFSFIGNATYQEELLRAYAQVLQLHFYDEGYLEARIEPPVVTLTPDLREIFITIGIKEGPRYEVAGVGVKGDLLWDESEILEWVETEAGITFSRKRLLADVDRISHRYGDEGYAFANITPQTNPYTTEEGKHLVDVTFAIDKGEPVAIDRIEIVGNMKTRDRVIRREMRIAEKERFNRTALEESRKRIERLGFFDTVSYSTEQVPGSRDRVNIRFEVVERPTGSVQIGAGFSSLDRFFAQAAISEQNLFGYGQQVQLQAQLGTQLQSVFFSFRDRRLFDSYWEGSFSVFSQRRRDFGFDKRETGGSIQIGYELTEVAPWLEDVRARGGISFRHIELIDLSSALEDLAARGLVNRDSITFALTGQVSHNTLNNFVEPSEGMLHSASFEFADDYFVIDADVNKFVKYRLEGSYYLPVWKGIVFATRWELGLLDRREDEDPLFQERFRGGGITNLRGYDPRSVGPYLLNDVDQSGDALLGGDKEFYTQAEFVIPVPPPQLRLKLVVFFDIGQVYNDNEQLFSSMLADWGFGIRWFSPLGPIRFEFGWPLVDDLDHTGERDLKGPVFNFALGQVFL